MQTDVMHISMANGCVSHLVTIMKYPKRSHLWEEGLFGLRVQEEQPDMVEDAWWQKHEATGHMVLSFRNQREV